MNEPKISTSEFKPSRTPPPGSGLQQRAQEAVSTAKTELEKLKSAAQEEGGAAIEQIKTAAQSVTLQAQEAGRDFIEEQKGNLAQKVDQYMQALRMASERLRSEEGNMLADPAQKAADRLERISGYLREKQLPDVLDDLESYTRRKPEVVYGGLFVAGLAAARFFKASRKRRHGSDPPEASSASSHTLFLSPSVPSSAPPTASSTP